MHCLNVVTEGAGPGDDNGATILIGGKRTLKIGDLMGTVVVPFMPPTPRRLGIPGRNGRGDHRLQAENALEHERCGEMIERIGLVNFLEGIDIDVDPNMVNHPREVPHVRMDGWDDEVLKRFEASGEASRIRTDR